MRDVSALRNGTLLNNVGALDWRTWELGPAYHFSGDPDEHLEIKDFSDLQQPPGLTVVVMIRGTVSETNKGIVVHGATGNWMLRTSNDGIGETSDRYAFQINTTTPSTVKVVGTSAISSTSGAWHMLVGTYNRQALKIWFDGLEEASQAETAAIFSEAGTLKIGGRATGLGLDVIADLGDVRVWGRALSASEIMRLWLDPWGAYSRRDAVTLRGPPRTSVKSSMLDPISLRSFASSSFLSDLETEGIPATSSLLDPVSLRSSVGSSMLATVRVMSTTVGSAMLSTSGVRAAAMASSIIEFSGRIAAGSSLLIDVAVNQGASSSGSSAHSRRSSVSGSSLMVLGTRLAVGSSHVIRREALTKPGWEVLLDGVLVGFIDESASPPELTGIAMADGRHEIEVRPSKNFWTPRVPESRWAGEVSGGTLLAAKPDAVQALRALVETGTPDNVEILWDYHGRFGTVDPDEFALWTSATTPVDVSGAPDQTVEFSEDGAYHMFLTLSADRYVAIRARTSTLDGPVSEVLVDLDATVPVTPPNQRATPNPPTYQTP